MKRTQVAVIGSGPGGALTACMLAEAGLAVTLFEEGAYQRLDSCVPFSLEEMVQKYRNGGLTVALGAPRVQYVEGCCVGGGSEINSGIYHRTPSAILARWRDEYHLADAAAEDLDEDFLACEQALHVAPHEGPLPPASIKLRDGAAALGWQSAEMPRWFHDGRRQSMTETFIPRALTAGATLLAGLWVRRLRRNSMRWLIESEPAITGVRAVDVEADYVFLCAGAIGTPALLQRSGIGRYAGKTLRLHPTVKLVARFDDVVNDVGMGVPSRQVKEFSPRMSFGCSISSPPYLALAMGETEAGRRLVEREWRRMAVYYAMTAGESCGSVTALPHSRDPLVRYALNGRDADALRGGLIELARLLLAAGAREIYPVAAGAVTIRGERDVASLRRLSDNALNVMTIHLFSSCPMGERRERCTTDSYGRIFDVPGLRISDASLLPTSLGVNPQGSIVAFARRNVRHFLESVAT